MDLDGSEEKQRLTEEAKQAEAAKANAKADAIEGKEGPAIDLEGDNLDDSKASEVKNYE